MKYNYSCLYSKSAFTIFKIIDRFYIVLQKETQEALVWWEIPKKLRDEQNLYFGFTFIFLKTVSKKKSLKLIIMCFIFSFLSNDFMGLFLQKHDKHNISDFETT